MKKVVCLAAAVALSALGSFKVSAAGFEIDYFLETLTNGFSVGAYTQVDSAYISSGNSIGDSRPVLQQCVSMARRFGDYGRSSAYAWTPSSLNPRNDDSRRRAYYWLETGIDYSYTWKFNDSLALYTRPLLFWGIPAGCRTERHSSVNTKFTQRLENPFINPYYCVYGRFAPVHWWQVSLGLMREIAISERLTLTPTVEFAYSDERRYEARYGVLPPERMDRFSAMVARITLRWWFADHWNTYLILKQYDTLGHHSREAVKRQTSHADLRDLTAVSVGVACSF